MILLSQEQIHAKLVSLKSLPCPNCKKIGFLNRHGFLRGYDSHATSKKSIRANRVFCNNRFSSQGCGRTFSIWLANTIKRLSLSAQQLWQFLSCAACASNKASAFEALGSSLSHSTAYRIWNRFQKAQSAIRTALTRLCPPPRLESLEPAQHTLEHLKTAFQWVPESESIAPNPIAYFQAQLQICFL